MICTPAELYEITHRIRPSAQARMLRAMGIAFIPRCDGTVVVLRSHVEHLLGGAKGTTIKTTEPNWKALDAKATTRK